ncbi:MAG: hypothetical protein AB9836_08385 [Aminipila sp.]
MKKGTDEETIALNEMLFKLYIGDGDTKEVGTKSEINTADSPYKNFVNENTKKLKEIFKAMEFDIEQFKNDKDRYEIPNAVAEIFKLYLNKEDGGKGSFISKLKRKKFLEITYEEKLKFIGNAVAKLRDKYENHTEVIDELNRKWTADAKYYEDIKCKIKEIKEKTNYSIEEAISNVASITELEGLVSVNTYDDLMEEKIFEEILNEISENKDLFSSESNPKENNVPYSIKLNESDRMELVNYLGISIENNIKQWKKIVDIACELREGEIIETSINCTDFISSEELVRLAIEEYEKELKLKKEANHSNQDSPEKMQEILKSIRLEMNAKKAE